MIKGIIIWVVLLGGVIVFGYLNFVEIEGFEPGRIHWIAFVVFTALTLLRIILDPLDYRKEREGYDTSGSYVDYDS